MPQIQLLFICGGRGTRLAGQTGHGRPKSMLRIKGQPLLHYLLEQFMPLHKVAAPPLFVVAANDDEAISFIRERVSSASVIYQQTPDGVANAILLSLPHIKADFVLAILGDLVMRGEFSEPLPSTPALGIWMEGTAASISRNYGIIVEDNKVTDLIEKPPQPSGMLCGMGVYLLTPALIESFALAPVNEAKKEREITEALKFALNKGASFSTIPFKGLYININSAADMKLAEAQLI